MRIMGKWSPVKTADWIYKQPQLLWQTVHHANIHTRECAQSELYALMMLYVTGYTYTSSRYTYERAREREKGESEGMHVHERELQREEEVLPKMVNQQIE
jgi:hypothetical protein